MLAAKFIPGEKKLSLKDVAIPEPGPKEVLLKVRAAGICHSDLHILSGEIPYTTSFTMGHEGCGEVVKTGSAVKEKFKDGVLYAVHGPNPCGECSYCKSGHDNLCNSPDRAYIGIGADGAYAEYMVVPARNIVEVPPGISPQVAAVATDAVLTPYHAIKTLGEVTHNTKVLLIGLGGLGMNGLQVALALEADVTVCDLRESSLESAKKLGAKKVINSKFIEQELKPQSFDVVVDFVGRDSTFLQSQKFVRAGGTIVLVGLGSSQVPIVTASLATYQVKVQGSFWGTHKEMQEVYDLIADKKIKPEVQTAPLKEVNHWLEELEAGKIPGRMALIP
nr:zinc-binding dehydrogenase [Bacteriovorax sp. HI3]